MKLQYCPSSEGILLLNKNTNTEWRAISPLMLSHNMCVATILPRRPVSYPIIAQYCYLPKNFINSGGLISKSEQLYKSLQTRNQRALKVVPSIKYGLDGVSLTMTRIVPYGIAMIEVEGAISLTGDIVVKPTDGMSPMTLSINNKSAQMLLSSAEQTRSDFISSLKIHNFVLEGKPSLTIGSSLADKVAMTATSLQLTGESPNSTKITASFIPHYYEIQTRFGLTLEIQIGYEFSGKATLYPSQPNQAKLLNATQNDSVAKKVVTAGGSLIGIRILCVYIIEVTLGLLLAG